MCAHVYTHTVEHYSALVKETSPPARSVHGPGGLVPSERTQTEKKCSWPHSHMESCKYSELVGRAARDRRVMQTTD